MILIKEESYLKNRTGNVHRKSLLVLFNYYELLTKFSIHASTISIEEIHVTLRAVLIVNAFHSLSTSLGQQIIFQVNHPLICGLMKLEEEAVIETEMITKIFC